ncbi:MAG: cytochrome c [Alphaproteobacteria bacterium]|jgi:mono/diheme cytochrome c family protein|nr:cytochrome c [Alphaproteobacteria bacterium]
MYVNGKAEARVRGSGMMQFKFRVSMSRLTATAGVALLVSAGAMAQGRAPDPAIGETLAKQWCTQCHVVDEGTTVGADAGPPFPALARSPKTSASAIRGFLHEPQQPMPPLELTKQDIDDLVAYIESLKAPEAPK